MNRTLLSLFGLPITAYALGMTLSAALVIAFVFLHSNRYGLKLWVTETFILMAIPLCLLLARLVYVLARLDFFLERGEGMALRLWQGGYTLWGAIPGFLLAGILTARLAGLKSSNLLDILTPAGLLMLALGRFCEGLSGQGFGEESSTKLSFFPFAVVNEYGEWRWAIFMLEGMAALLFMLILFKEKNLYPGGVLRHALTLLCASQILFESLREDEFLRWGFVRLGQLLPAILLLLLMITASKKAGEDRRVPIPFAGSMFAFLILLVIALEFAFDKTSLGTGLIYAAMLLAVIGLYAIVRAAGLTKRRTTV